MGEEENKRRMIYRRRNWKVRVVGSGQRCGAEGAFQDMGEASIGYVI